MKIYLSKSSSDFENEVKVTNCSRNKSVVAIKSTFVGWIFALKMEEGGHCHQNIINSLGWWESSQRFERYNNFSENIPV